MSATMELARFVANKHFSDPPAAAGRDSGKIYADDQRIVKLAKSEKIGPSCGAPGENEGHYLFDPPS